MDRDLFDELQQAARAAADPERERIRQIEARLAVLPAPDVGTEEDARERAAIVAEVAAWREARLAAKRPPSEEAP